LTAISLYFMIFVTHNGDVSLQSWRHSAAPKLPQISSGIHGITSQKTEFIIPELVHEVSFQLT